MLIGLDGSPSSSAAVDLALRWARGFKAMLVGLGVVDQPVAFMHFLWAACCI
jgi:hypothetical protein